MSRVHVCVEHTCSPFGRQAAMGMAVGSMFVAGALVARQWFMALELRVAQHLMVFALILIVLRRIEAVRA